MRIWIDGVGASFEGQESKIAVMFENEMLIVRKIDRKLTNNEAEYLALHEALAHYRTYQDVIFTDSQLLVGQMTMGWKIKAENLIEIALKCKDLLQKKKCELKWIRREHNLAGKLFERED
jgi:ribonuclease HI